MMKIGENPLSIFGLDRQFVSTLSGDQLERVVEVLYRGLQGIFHPDKQGGNAEKSKALNWAKDQLSSRQALLAWKKHYVGGMKRNRLLEEVEFLRDTNDGYLEEYLYPLLRRLCQENIAGKFTDFVGLRQRGLRINRLPKGGMMETLGIETAIHSAYKNVADRKKAKNLVKIRNAFFLRVKKGVLTEENLETGAVTPFPRLPIGTLRVEDVMAYTNSKFTNPHELIRCLYADFYPQKQVSQLPSPKETLTRAALLTAIPAEVFKPVFRFLKTRPPEKWEYLISASMTDDHLSFHIEGVVYPLE